MSDDAASTVPEQLPGVPSATVNADEPWLEDFLEQEGGPAEPAPPTTGRAGRDLGAAVAVALVLVAVLLSSLLIRKEAFLVVAGIVVSIGTWEIRAAVQRADLAVPLVPLIMGVFAMLAGGFLAGGQGLAVAAGATAMVVAGWRGTSGAGQAREVSATLFAMAYPGLLAGFTALMLRESDGVGRIVVFVIVTVFSDIGGYATGVVFGRHPMAPSVSPKKSWEGFIGSLVWCGAAGALAVPLVLHGHWAIGLLLGVLGACCATLGDLFESLIKRDLGIKDMSAILPGHGGVMDRLDSLVITAPVTWAVMALCVPVVT